jgi:ubiquitin carboxyl-terminal hydrolase 8
MDPASITNQMDLDNTNDPLDKLRQQIASNHLQTHLHPNISNQLDQLRHQLNQSQLNISSQIVQPNSQIVQPNSQIVQPNSQPSIDNALADPSETLQRLQRHFEYLAKLDVFVKKTTDTDFITNEMNIINQHDLSIIYQKKVGSSGIENIGNTCYMNAILQCLRHTLILNGYLFGPKINDVILRNQQSGKINNHRIALVIIYMKNVVTLWNHDNCVLTPLAFKTFFSMIYKDFQNNLQHDAHEFLVTFLDFFHETLSRTVKYKVNGEILNEYDRQLRQAHDDWAIYYKRRHSAILDIFSGQLQTRTICSNCGKISDRYDPMMNIQLSIPSQTCSIVDCFNTYIEPERLEGENSFNCENCNRKVTACKNVSIWTLPNILIIHLKRFQYVPKIGDYSKINTHIHYPLTGLDLSAYTHSPIKNNPVYNLYAVACHRGTHQQGHYYSYCYSPYKAKWTLYDDQTTYEVIDTSNVTNTDAYILFYRKRD